MMVAYGFWRCELHVGERDRINLGSSEFRRFIEERCLYVDKTAFIEHVLDDASDVLLFCRPRRMGKTLNLDMLRTFLDPKSPEGTAGLFDGLHIEGSQHFSKLGSTPVVWMSFKDFRPESRGLDFARAIMKNADRYLGEVQPSGELKRLALALSKYEEDLDFEIESRVDVGLLKILTDGIFSALGVRPWLLIDEYDALVMGSAGQPQFKDAVQFTRDVLGPAIKDNRSLGKAVITGVNRIAQESLFSGVNNLEVCDVFAKGAFDCDFGFTEDEVAELCTPEELAEAREWYNGFRVGGEKVYFTYSVMSYLKSGQLRNYWGKSGVMDTIKHGLDYGRFGKVSALVGGFGQAREAVTVKDRLSAKDIQGFRQDGAFWSLLVQTGYMTYDAARAAGTTPWSCTCRTWSWPASGRTSS